MFPIMSTCLQALGTGPRRQPSRIVEPDAAGSETLAEGEIVGRFVMSFATREEPVERLIALIAA